MNELPTGLGTPPRGERGATRTYARIDRRSAWDETPHENTSWLAICRNCWHRRVLGSYLRIFPGSSDGGMGKLGGRAIGAFLYIRGLIVRVSDQSAPAACCGASA